MAPILNLAGRRFGSLIALHSKKVSGILGRAWVCRCDCGNSCEVRAGNLPRGNTRSCGCKNRLEVSIGERYGRLTIVSEIKSHKLRNHTGRSFVCHCDCGSVLEAVSAEKLKSGHAKSCGCIKSDLRKSRIAREGTAMGQKSPERSCYNSARNRCTNPSNQSWPRYGGRGIEFRFDSFQQFIDCVGPRPSTDHTLDRINNDGHYEPGNVAWVPWKQNLANRVRRCDVCKNAIDSYSNVATFAGWHLPAQNLLEVARENL